ncbi:MAG: heparinase II/III family protein [Oscillospiraceae bacterium]|nr:heparinase II/III family protein [Oscillospiraceae bacterium]
MKRFFSIVLVLALLSGLGPSAAAKDSRGVSLTTDHAFFNALTLSAMPTVETAVQEGDYTLAKEALLKYYTEKFSNLDTVPGSAVKNAMLYLAQKQTFAFSEPYLSYVDIQGPEYQQYSLNLMGNKTGVYVLSMLDKTQGEILLPSRESGAMAPKLLITCADNSSKTLEPTADTFVRAGSYASKNYGSESTLYVRDDYSGTDPFGNHTKRVYLRFDSTQIPSNAKSVKLSLYAKCSGGSEASLRLHVFGAYNTSWSESGLTWDWLKNNKSLAHFSWNNMPGGFTWVAPVGVPSEWARYNGRFYEVTSLVQAGIKAGVGSQTYRDYLTLAKNLMLDFIQDAGAGSPSNTQGLEPANRMLEFPYIYKQLLEGGFLTPEENMTLLSWVYDEANYLSDKSQLFSPQNQVLSDLAYYHGFRHLTGFYQGCGYFPEFKQASKWSTNYAARQSIVVNALVLEDGSYSQITFGYQSEMINCGIVLLAAMDAVGDRSYTAEIKTKLIRLARYLVSCTQPNGSLPYWGQGAPSRTKSVVETVLSAIGNSMDQDPMVEELRRFVAGGENPGLATHAVYDASKVAVDRTGWGSEDTMLFMNAKCGGNHGHRDALALLLYYRGRQLLTDTGMTSYDSAHAHFNWQNSTTRSHNTIEVDGKAQILYQNLFDVTSMGQIKLASNPSASVLTAWSDANNNNISTKSLSMSGVINNLVYHSTDFRHYRDVSFLKTLGDILVVTDKLVPGDSAVHSYTQNWHSAPHSNPSLAADAYHTGSTHFSQGSNLIIAQAHDHSTDPITASLRTGYDSTAPSSPTSYFEYKQSKSGTVTYQTLLYPVQEGATATVAPEKLAMSGTTDATALASRITVNDSSRPELKELYHYHSFEAVPSTRSFAAYTTNASTAVLGLGNEGIYFAALFGGSSLRTANRRLLSTSAKVSDLSATVEGSSLILESGDPNIAHMGITVNLNGQSVDNVLLNGEEIPFTQGTEGTVRIGKTYFLTHFDPGDPLASSSDWNAKYSTASVDTSKGLLNGTFSGHDPQIYTGFTLEHEITEGDVLELRIRNSISSGTYTPLQIFYTTDSDTGFTAQKTLRDTTTVYPSGEYVTLHLPFPTSAVGQTLSSFRIDMVNSNKTDPANGSYWVDYVYIGPGDTAPSVHKQGLHFDFTDTMEDRLRYTCSVYGDRNYDSGYWATNSVTTRNIRFHPEEGALSFELAEGSNSVYVQTCDASQSLSSTPLTYAPSVGDCVQLRFKLEHLQPASSTSVYMRLYYIKNNGTTGVVGSDFTSLVNLSESHFNGEYVTLTIPLAENFTSAEVINSVRLLVGNLAHKDGQLGTMTVDYISIGQPESLPEKPLQTFTVQFINEDGQLLATQTVKEGQSASYTGNTPTKAYDALFHYSFCGWDQKLSNITENTTFTAQFKALPHDFSYSNTDSEVHTLPPVPVATAERKPTALRVEAAFAESRSYMSPCRMTA